MKTVARYQTINTQEMIDRWRKLAINSLAAGIPGSVGFLANQQELGGGHQPATPVLLRSSERRWFGSMSWVHLAHLNDRLPDPEAQDRLQPVLLRRR